MRIIFVVAVTFLTVLLLACSSGTDGERQPTEEGFLDPQTGLIWLALRETRNRSHADISGDGALAAAGWRVASVDEVRQLLARWLPGAEGETRADAEGYARAAKFIQRMGYQHFNPASGSNNVYGILAADGGSPPVATIWTRVENGETQYGWFVDRYVHVDRDYQDDVVGVFLVRPAAGAE
ncbi:MAG: hypothetical protein PVI39_11425 [Desulfobacteraceae bacterium]|jgi:hypothetical protein